MYRFMFFKGDNDNVCFMLNVNKDWLFVYVIEIFCSKWNKKKMLKWFMFLLWWCFWYVFRFIVFFGVDVCIKIKGVLYSIWCIFVIVIVK